MAEGITQRGDYQEVRITGAILGPVSGHQIANSAETPCIVFTRETMGNPVAQHLGLPMVKSIKRSDLLVSSGVRTQSFQQGLGFNPDSGTKNPTSHAVQPK